MHGVSGLKNLRYLWVLDNGLALYALTWVLITFEPNNWGSEGSVWSLFGHSLLVNAYGGARTLANNRQVRSNWVLGFANRRWVERLRVDAQLQWPFNASPCKTPQVGRVELLQVNTSQTPGHAGEGPRRDPPYDVTSGCRTRPNVFKVSLAHTTSFILVVLHLFSLASDLSQTGIFIIFHEAMLSVPISSLVVELASHQRGSTPHTLSSDCIIKDEAVLENDIDGDFELDGGTLKGICLLNYLEH